MNAVRSYVDVFESILLADDTGTSDCWNKAISLLKTLETDLGCYCCEKLLTDPFSLPYTYNCGHCVCKKCIEFVVDKPCVYCKLNHQSFVPNLGMGSMVQCYKKMFEYAVNSSSYKSFLQSSHCVEDLNHTATGNFLNVIESDITDDDQADVNGVPNDLVDSCKSNGICSENGKTNTSTKFSNGKLRKFSSSSDPDDFVTSTQKFRKLSESSPHKTANSCDSMKTKDECVTIDNKTIVIKQEPTVKNKSESVFNQNSKSKSNCCRCGLATAIPGKLTCCGQRCPCYSNGNACMSCKCRGCRNPRNRSNITSQPTIEQCFSNNSLPLAANHSLISISRSKIDSKSDDEASDVDIDN